MRLHVTDRRPCRLERGDLRRVPQNPLSGVVGYHLCCLRCGFVTVALNGNDGLVITDDLGAAVALQQSINVAAEAAAAPTSTGGGGALSWPWLLALLLAAAGLAPMRAWRWY